VKELHIVLVCHMEMDFEGSWRLYDRVQPKIEEMISRVADAAGKRPKMTYCVTGEFLGEPERLEDAFRFIEEGHEIGIHSHLLGSHRAGHSGKGRYALRLDENGVLNQDLTGGALRQIAIALGLPAPASHVSGYYTFQQTTVKVLERAGFSVDCSLQCGRENERFHATGDFILCHTVRRKEPYPYRPDPDDPLADGGSSIIELPLCGSLGHGQAEGQLDTIRSRLEGDRAVDAFQCSWHHFEFADLGWTKGTFADAGSFLSGCGRMDNVIFSTASEAARALEHSGL
jgi:hypothetical protein